MTRAGLLLLLGIPLPLAAQDSRLARLEPALAAAVEAQLDSARAAGLPTDPLVQKALEGSGKGAPSDRILAAVRAVRLSLGEARAVLGPVAAGELTAGANALRAGATSETLAGMREGRRGDRSLQVPLEVLSDLIARGVPSARAGAAVARLVRQGTDDRQLQLLRERIDQDIRGGTAPGVALDRRLAGIPAAGAPIPP